MNFLQWLNSFDELLYEVLSWLVFFPITIWRIVRRPLAMMDYAEAELDRPEEEQFTQTVSPPVTLVLALLICQALELTVIGANQIVINRHGLAGLVDDNTSLLLLRVLLFGMFPLVFATGLVRRRGVPLDRETLKRPFYAQCYLVAPFALLLSFGSLLTVHHLTAAKIAGVALCTVALLGYGTIQACWFARHLNQSFARGFLTASRGMVESLAIALVIGLLFAV